MKKIIFVCHGNICRSPAAEWIMKQQLIKYHLENMFIIESRATSLEEIGNDIYPPMKKALYNRNIPFFLHKARQINKADYDSADYIFYMDSNNYKNLCYLIPDTKNKYHPIFEFTDGISIIDDPWYTGQFDTVVNQLIKCINDIILSITKSH